MSQESYESVFDAIFDADDELAAEMKFRADLLMMLGEIFALNSWSQQEIMEHLDIPQSRASELQRGRINKFSSEKLIGYLARLGYVLSLYAEDIQAEEKEITVHAVPA